MCSCRRSLLAVAILLAFSNIDAAQIGYTATSVEWLTITTDVVAVAKIKDVNQPRGDQPRKQFAERMGAVKEGMSPMQVTKILGSPDTVWTEKTKTPFRFANVSEVWCYGCDGDYGFPTLGRVEFDLNSTVKNVVGHQGQVIDDEIVDEELLRKLLGDLDSAPTFYGRRYDPYDMMQLARDFQPLGQAKTFAVFREYVRVTGSRMNEDGMYLLIFCLHDVGTDGSQLSGLFPGVPVPAPPKDTGKAPRFPIKYVDGVPLLLTRGLDAVGDIEIDFAIKKCEKAKIPWMPEQPQVNDKSREELLNALKAYTESADWYFSGEESDYMQKMLSQQLDRYVEHRDESRAPQCRE